LRVRYLQACERIQEARALSKSCLESCEAGKHLYFRQAYLTCLYKASLHEHLHKEIAEIDGRDAVEIICNTESVEKDELLLSMGKTFLKQQLHNGDMYYIWDLVFIWSRLHLRAHPSRQGFLAECLDLASSATNVRAIFPFIKLVTAELGGEGVHVCLELCARALQLCDAQADVVTRSLVCKTIAFLLPHDLEICRACALLVFCQERSLEAYRTVCLLYMLPDQEPHPHNSPVRTNVRFHVLQMLKERLCFDPEFWNLLTLRAHCMELNCLSDSCTDRPESRQTFEAAVEEQELPVQPLLKAEVEGCVDTPRRRTSEEKKMEKTWRDKALRTQKYAHVKHHCKWCHKDYKGLNVMRHALSHLRAGKRRCILCGKRLHQFSSAKKHILEHIDQMDKDKPSAKETGGAETKATNGKSDGRADPNPPQEADGKEMPEGQAGEGADSTYYLCPSESCDKVFLKINSTLTKHAVKYHLKEDDVLKKIFVWCNRKCILCTRNIQCFEHYKDHMKLHDAPLQHFCYHLECGVRFPTQQELKDHVSTHQPFRPQCRFTDCETLFPNLQSLHDHEWRHY
uniref:C2H2-type domain-containing protein n=1 Tax=Tetraodon nigroviridis TaxID=99883 RepID=H3BWW3_TETNG